MTTLDSPPRPADELVERIPPIVDVDAHLVEPPDIWTSRLPQRYRDVGPRVELLPPGVPILQGGGYLESPGTEGPPVAWWHYEDHLYSVKRLIAAAGYPADEIDFRGVTFDDMRPGCWQQQARLDDMTLNGVEAQLCYPNYPRFAGQIFLRAADKVLAKLCVEAYNDWMVEEWCGDADGRLIPLPLIPLWDVNLAVEEINRNAARGCTAVAFSEIPAKLGLPTLHSRYWDPFFAACNDTETLICMHIGSSSQMPATSSDAPPAVAATLSFGNAMSSFSDYLFSGVLVRYPKLRLAYSEGQIGWLPYMIERADDVWLQHRAWGGVRETIPEPPSTYYKDRIFGCFFRDKHGLESLASIGEDQVTFETDYPHTDSTWPYTRKIFAEQVQHLDDATVYKIARGNAINMLRLSPDGRWRP